MSSLAQLPHCTYAIPFTVLLQVFAYACTSIMYYILCNIQVPGTLSWVSCLLVASPTERDQHCDLCVAPGGDLWHIPYFPQKSRQVKYHCYQLRMSWTSTVTVWVQQGLGKLIVLGCANLFFSWVVMHKRGANLRGMVKVGDKGLGSKKCKWT